MSVKVYNSNVTLSKHFNSFEFKCPHCGKIKISSELISKLEVLFDRVNASKCIISSGYRCRDYDIKENGFAGRHSEGLACDCVFYDKRGNVIPSKVICCVAYDLGFSGIAYIDYSYTHLDVRSNGVYRGDETRGNGNYWTNPYTYFGVSKSEVEKYTGVSSLKYQVFGNRWYSNVTSGTNEYAGVFGVSIKRVYIDKLKYRVKSNGRWLPEVIGRSDYAGYSNGSSITDIAIDGAIYRVHVKGGNWLSWVSGYNVNDYKNGYAGNGRVIDALQIK